MPPIPAVDRQRTQPGDDGRRREPGGARQRGCVRRLDAEDERGGGRIEGLVHVAGERYLRRAGFQVEIERQRLLIAFERAVQGGLAEGFGANVGIDVEERSDAFERICSAFDLQLEARLRRDRARHARDRDACARGIVDHRPAHAQAAVGERGIEIQPGEADAAIGESIDRERDIGVDLVENGPGVIGGGAWRRPDRLLRRRLRFAGLGCRRGSGVA